ncbi:hypothetical protein CALCODRAFT_510064 [Calocera cornea HHB12733]|uniref:Uncharacterized protein n=1 Tax=Calocera cornea HHB12733 TaxID=1353952 RepID=A0A165EUE1_9BASI|nr:hypothetical protein CALCODRAFT_510064 [Calocera cornea HHB12733]
MSMAEDESYNVRNPPPFFLLRRAKAGEEVDTRAELGRTELSTEWSEITVEALFHTELQAFIFALVTGKTKPISGLKPVQLISPTATRFVHMLCNVLCEEISIQAGDNYQRQLDKVSEFPDYYTKMRDYPINALRTVSKVATAIVLNKPSLPDLMWDKGQENIIYQGMPINIAQFYQGVRSIVGITEHNFFSEL